MYFGYSEQFSDDPFSDWPFDDNSIDTMFPFDPPKDPTIDPFPPITPSDSSTSTTPLNSSPDAPLNPSPDAPLNPSPDDLLNASIDSSMDLLSPDDSLLNLKPNELPDETTGSSSEGENDSICPPGSSNGVFLNTRLNTTYCSSNETPPFLQYDFSQIANLTNYQFQSFPQFNAYIGCSPYGCSTCFPRGTISVCANITNADQMKAYLQRKISGNSEVRFNKATLHYLYSIFANTFNWGPLSRNEKRKKQFVFQKLYENKYQVIDLIQKYPSIIDQVLLVKGLPKGKNFQ